MTQLIDVRHQTTFSLDSNFENRHFQKHSDFVHFILQAHQALRSRGHQYKESIDDWFDEDTVDGIPTFTAYGPYMYNFVHGTYLSSSAPNFITTSYHLLKGLMTRDTTCALSGWGDLRHYYNEEPTKNVFDNLQADFKARMPEKAPRDWQLSDAIEAIRLINRHMGHFTFKDGCWSNIEENEGLNFGRIEDDE